jgi:TPR repeat protein
MVNLAVLLEDADPPDLDGAWHWFRQAAEAGSCDAMFGLGMLLEERGELGEAETWYRRAAEAGTAMR